MSERERASFRQTGQTCVKRPARSTCVHAVRGRGLFHPHDKISSDDAVSTLELARPLDPWGLSVTGPGFDLSRVHCETPAGAGLERRLSLDKPPGRREIEDVNPSQNGNTDLMPGFRGDRALRMDCLKRLQSVKSFSVSGPCSLVMM